MYHLMALLAKVVASVTDHKDELTTLVERYQGKTEVREDKPVPVALSTTSHTDRLRIEPGPLTREGGLIRAKVPSSLHRPTEA
jgi:hypothetical protein